MGKSWRQKQAEKSKDMRDKQFLNRISKTLYYTKFPSADCLSLPLTELTADFFTKIRGQPTLEKLDVDDVSRISKEICISPCILVFALLYTERVKHNNAKYLQQVTPCELFLVSLMVASKFLHDDGENEDVLTAEWAISGKLTVSKMIKLEKDFLNAIEWTLFVQQEDFQKRLEQLERDVAYHEMQKRGWCSYTEMFYLMNTTQLIAIARTVIDISCGCLITYIAGLMTLYGAVYITHAIMVVSVLGTSIYSRFIKQNSNLQMNITENVKLLDSMSDTGFCNIGELPIMTESLGDDKDITNHLTVENEDITNYQVSGKTDNNGIISWQWWLNSTMTWLPEYCGLRNDGTSESIKFNSSSFLINKSLLNPVVADDGSSKTRQTRTHLYMLENHDHYKRSWKNILCSVLSWLTQFLQEQFYELCHRRVSQLPNLLKF